jgi:hypothetical protein
MGERLLRKDRNLELEVSFVNAVVAASRACREIRRSTGLGQCVGYEFAVFLSMLDACREGEIAGREREQVASDIGCVGDGIMEASFHDNDLGRSEPVKYIKRRMMFP